jgi:hypothetical protein
MAMKISLLASALAFPSLPACGSDGSEPKRSTFDNTGALCLSPDNGNGNRVRIQAVVNSCVSGCEVIESVTCSASITGNRIEVSSHLELTRTSGPACTTDCRHANAECGIVRPAPGTQQLVYGSNEAELSVPLSTSTRLFGVQSDCDFED